MWGSSVISERIVPAGPTDRFEAELRARGVGPVAGIDEAGRGPLAGPVVAAAVILPPDVTLPGVDDSKKLSPANREELFALISSTATAVGIGMAGHDEIDAVNILQATFRAMHRAVAALHPSPAHLLIDGNRFAADGIPFTTIVGGDARCLSIAAASIIAKVTRDRIMCAYDATFPGYGFAQHKGYGTLRHRNAIRDLGPCPIHRRSFLGRILQPGGPEEGCGSGQAGRTDAPDHAGPPENRAG